jgi:hypothetical protein
LSFEHSFFSAETSLLAADLKSLKIAFNHKPRFPETKAHQKFKASYLAKVKQLKQRYPHLDLDEESGWFAGA